MTTWSKVKKKAMFWVYVLMILVMFLLPFFSVESYSIIANTTSHLGAQQAPHAWVMNVVFVLLGVATIIRVSSLFNNYKFTTTMLIVFGLGLIMTALFRHRPIIEGVEFDLLQDQLHSLFASVVGFSFVMSCVTLLFENTTKQVKVMAIVLGVFASLLSWMMFMFPSIMGILQRIMFLVSFYWIMRLSDHLDKDQVDI